MGTSKLEFLGAATIILKVLFVSCMNIYKYCFCVIFFIILLRHVFLLFY